MFTVRKLSTRCSAHYLRRLCTSKSVRIGPAQKSLALHKNQTVPVNRLDSHTEIRPAEMAGVSVKPAKGGGSYGTSSLPNANRTEAFLVQVAGRGVYVFRLDRSTRRHPKPR